jgi:hypothetical protein
MDIKEMSKSPECPKYSCEFCDYKCSKSRDWGRHVKTVKHTHRLNGNNKEILGNTKPTEYSCKCEKKFKTNAGLWKHKKNCVIKNTEHPIVDKDLIMLLIKKNDDLQTVMMEQQKSIMEHQNKNVELQTMMLEVIKNGTHNTTNSHNKAFNLNFFLNETCKDAMNITEFVNSIQLQLSDLERMGEVGYVEGLSSIISRNLKALDVNMRPVHCTDKKREIMYIKDETKWEKDEENTKMHKMVKNVAFENQRQILKYKEIHPDCGKSTSKFSDAYNKILVECMGGPGDNDFEKEEKIISKISKCVLVDKDPAL